ncbi:hypothetical protein B0H19DRAFT_485646 [Mycena capillaripes]|nr:hypothetical protein B0H19DRAFT_485646 [Mycena capillaripes]
MGGVFAGVSLRICILRCGAKGTDQVGCPCSVDQSIPEWVAWVACRFISVHSLHSSPETPFWTLPSLPTSISVYPASVANIALTCIHPFTETPCESHYSVSAETRLPGSLFLRTSGSKPDRLRVQAFTFRSALSTGTSKLSANFWILRGPCSPKGVRGVYQPCGRCLPRCWTTVSCFSLFQQMTLTEIPTRRVK